MANGQYIEEKVIFVSKFDFYRVIAVEVDCKEESYDTEKPKGRKGFWFFEQSLFEIFGARWCKFWKWCKFGVF